MSFWNASKIAETTFDTANQAFFETAFGRFERGLHQFHANRHPKLKPRLKLAATLLKEAIQSLLCYWIISCLYLKVARPP